MAVWTRYAAGEAAAESAEPVHLPPQVQELASQLQSRMAGEVTTAWLAMHRELDAVVSSRYQSEMVQLEQTRARYEEDMAGANAAVEAGDQREAALLKQLSATEAEVSELRLRRKRPPRTADSPA